MAERDVEVESTVARIRRRVERGDGAALDDEERVARAAPLDVLRPAEVSLDPRPQCGKLEDELVRERLPLLVARGDLLGHRPAIGQAPDGERFPGDAPVDDRPGADLVQVGGNEARDERLADPEARVDGDGPRRPVIGSAVNMIPETSGRTIRWTTTERSTERCGKPFVAR